MVNIKMKEFFLENALTSFCFCSSLPDVDFRVFGFPQTSGFSADDFTQMFLDDAGGRHQLP